MRSRNLVFTMGLSALVPVLAGIGVAARLAQAQEPFAPAGGNAAQSASSSLGIPAAYAPVVGTHAVEDVTEILLHDFKRNKDLPVYAAFPKEAGAYPVIVFSHGAGGSGDRESILARFWASHGYVCLCPTHADSIKLTRFKGSAIPNNLAKVVARTTGSVDSGLERAKDISFLLDALPTLETRIPSLKGKMDTNHIGMAGHSLGAYTTMLIGGAVPTDPNTGKPVSAADKRPRAFLVLSGQGTGQQGLTAHSWDHFTRPLMNVTGSLDQGAGGQGPDWKQEPYSYCPPGDKYQLFIEGANHGSFTGHLAMPGSRMGMRGGAGGRLLQVLPPGRSGQIIPPREGSAPGTSVPPTEQNPKTSAANADSTPPAAPRLNAPLRRTQGQGLSGFMARRQQAGGEGMVGDQKAIFGAVETASLAFWDAYLKADSKAKAFLQSDALARANGGMVKVSRK